MWNMQKMITFHFLPNLGWIEVDCLVTLPAAGAKNPCVVGWICQCLQTKYAILFGGTDGILNFVFYFIFYFFIIEIPS
jgi:hypothetical protein